MRDPLSEKLNRDYYRKRKLNNFHDLVDCFHAEMSDIEIAQEINISPEKVRRWREKYEE